MTERTHALHHRGRGFSLVELMVALALGMFAVLVMMQALALTDAGRRTTTGGDDAQVNGSVAVYSMVRDIRMSGFGVAASDLLGCSLSFTTSADAAAVTIEAIAPLRINPPSTQVPAGDPNTDTLLVMFASTNATPEGNAISQVVSGNAYQVTAASTFAQGDLAIVQESPAPSPCALTLDKVASVDSGTQVVQMVEGGRSAPSKAAIAYNLGSAPVLRAYAVRKGQLTVCDYRAYDCGNAKYAAGPNASVWSPVASNIVSLRAGYEGTSNGTAPTPKLTSDIANYPTLACAWAALGSVRLAVVARNPQFNKAAVTSDPPVWSSGFEAGSATNPIDLSANPDWQNYRYRTVQASVPLRNIVWQAAQSQGGGGC